MARRLTTLVLALALPMAFAVPAAAAPPADKPDTRPLCADYTDGEGTYVLAQVDFVATLSAPSCPDVTYTLFVWDGDGGASGPQTLIASESQQGDGESLQITWSFLAPDDDAEVCVYGKTFTDKGRELDRAPDVGCLLLSATGSPGHRWT